MFIESLGTLSLGTRLKLLSDRLYDACDEVYRERASGIEARWALYLRLLCDRGPLSTTEIAEAVGTSHSAVSQLAPKLEARGVIARRRDPNDDRRTLLALTAKGRRTLEEVEPLWAAIQEGVSDAVQRSGHDLLAAIGAFEAALKAVPLSRDVLQRHARRAPEQVRIEPFQPVWREHFYRLNAAWLTAHFVIEPIDQRILADPEGEILDKGGRVFFALLGHEVIGTVGLERHGRGVYELIKMAVDERYRGVGAGRLLLQRAIDEFHQLRGRELYLESNSALKPALKLYESAGFVRQRGPRPGTEYARADVYMVYRPKAASARQSKTGEKKLTRRARR